VQGVCRPRRYSHVTSPQVRRNLTRVKCDRIATCEEFLQRNQYLSQDCKSFLLSDIGAAVWPASIGDLHGNRARGGVGRSGYRAVEYPIEMATGRNSNTIDIRTGAHMLIRIRARCEGCSRLLLAGRTAACERATSRAGEIVLQRDDAQARRTASR
jgi:hypothetical protein